MRLHTLKVMTIGATILQLTFNFMTVLFNFHLFVVFIRRQSDPNVVYFNINVSCFLYQFLEKCLPLFLCVIELGISERN